MWGKRYGNKNTLKTHIFKDIKVLIVPNNYGLNGAGMTLQ